MPVRIDVLKRHHKDSEPKVCRLVGCAAGGRDLSGKCSSSNGVEPERRGLARKNRRREVSALGSANCCTKGTA